MQFPGAKSAGDLHADVFPGEPKFLFTVRALGKDIGLADVGAGGVEAKIDVAELALDSLTQVLAVDFEFLSTLWAVDEQTCGHDFDHRIELLQGDEDRNLHAVSFEFWIEQRATTAAVNHARRHVIATLWTGTTRPGWHRIAFPNCLIREMPTSCLHQR